MGIKAAENKLWEEIIKHVDFNNSKNVQQAIDNLKEECKIKNGKS